MVKLVENSVRVESVKIKNRERMFNLMRQLAVNAENQDVQKSTVSVSKMEKSVDHNASVLTVATDSELDEK